MQGPFTLVHQAKSLGLDSSILSAALWMAANLIGVPVSIPVVFHINWVSGFFLTALVCCFISFCSWFTLHFLILPLFYSSPSNSTLIHVKVLYHIGVLHHQALWLLWEYIRYWHAFKWGEFIHYKRTEADFLKHIYYLDNWFHFPLDFICKD